jgi:hypothetical protein
MAARTQDPILDSYLDETANHFQYLNDYVSYQIGRVRRSIYSSSYVDRNNLDGYRSDIYTFYNPLREWVKESVVRPRGGPARLRRSPQSIYESYQSQRQLLGDSHAKILANRRQYIEHITQLDKDFAKCIDFLDEAGQRVERLYKAMSGDDTALREIYTSILGSRLEQKSAPYLFDVISYVLRIRDTKKESIDKNDSLSRSISFLAVQARKLADSVKVSNVDKRFEAALEEYYAMIIGNFDPILIDLFSNKLRAFLVELRDELSGYVVADTTALLLSQEQVLRQFPEWRDFAKAASEFSPDSEQQETQRKTILRIAQETKANPNVASMEVSTAFERLDEAASKPTTSPTIKLGTWRSLENFTKENIRKLLEIARELSERATYSAAENNYIDFIEKLLPHLKLFIRMVESLHWLEPVVAWMEELLKKRK